ncbi:sulfite exporter TauE/SafE family protein [Cylindrospermum sp. FACHB-282]|uniref:sulfite exporter TauE/SafE family protein n=1 Tax=Cylindrospermum sp. FACHB-282 TaxID=2692794 RepID=UPI0016829104|nr:sulfite exporter TauE/SafE family protein [Cylindrospermum sp. FACHB-282]MBD2385400.1 sulfite exporter TauE/SafE family protein [Cylindrospermum sp. FACHB-282]
MTQVSVSSILNVLHLFPIGIVVGIISAILGIGGGLLYVPALAAIGASPIQSVATSLVAISLGAISGTIQNWKMNAFKIETVSLLTFPAMLTTEIGVGIANALPSKWLLLSFAGLQIAAIWLINLKNKLQKVEKKAAEIELPQSTVNSTMPILKTQGIGLIAGVLSGLFGVGGGIVMVPLQVLVLKMPIKEAIQTSYGAIVLISLWAVSRYIIVDSTNILIIPGLMLGLGSLFGANLGARQLPKLSDNLVRILFTFLLIFLASYMSFKAFVV